MESYEVLRGAVEQVGAKAVAAALSVSPSLVYKWCERPADEDERPGSGARNPLDRVAELIRCTGTEALVAWLCEQSGGCFVKNPPVSSVDLDQAFIANTQRLIQEFSDLLHVMSESYANQNRIDEDEARQIRREWEDLKRNAECFVASCEQGFFDPERTPAGPPAARRSGSATGHARRPPSARGRHAEGGQA